MSDQEFPTVVQEPIIDQESKEPINEFRNIIHNFEHTLSLNHFDLDDIYDVWKETRNIDNVRNHNQYLTSLLEKSKRYNEYYDQSFVNLFTKSKGFNSVKFLSLLDFDNEDHHYYIDKKMESIICHFCIFIAVKNIGVIKFMIDNGFTFDQLTIHGIFNFITVDQVEYMVNNIITHQDSTKYDEISYLFISLVNKEEIDNDEKYDKLKIIYNKMKSLDEDDTMKIITFLELEQYF